MTKPVALAALAAALAASASLAACATPRVNADGSTELRLGQRAVVGGPTVTPVKVLEDSRCPMEARCVWAGRVRLEVQVETGQGKRTVEVATDKPAPVADGALSLTNVLPPKSVRTPVAERDYRFWLKFDGGL